MSASFRFWLVLGLYIVGLLSGLSASFRFWLVLVLYIVGLVSDSVGFVPVWLAIVPDFLVIAHHTHTHTFDESLWKG